ncbi:hypothetical protein OROMI_003020 [Orobanche minor]
MTVDSNLHLRIIVVSIDQRRNSVLLTLNRNLMQAAFFMKPNPRTKPPLTENVLLPRDQDRVDERGPGSRLPVRLVFHITEKQDDFAVAHDGDVVIGAWFGFAVEFREPEVPENVDRPLVIIGVDQEPLGSGFFPEIPWLELDLAGVLVLLVGAFDRDGEAVEEQILAPSDGDRTAVTGYFGAVDRNEDVLA